jgi:hypothetical protein
MTTSQASTPPTTLGAPWAESNTAVSVGPSPSSLTRRRSSDCDLQLHRLAQMESWLLQFGARIVNDARPLLCKRATLRGVQGAQAPQVLGVEGLGIEFLYVYIYLFLYLYLYFCLNVYLYLYYDPWYSVGFRLSHTHDVTHTLVLSGMWMSVVHGACI